MGATWWLGDYIDAFVILPPALNKKYLKAKDDAGEGFGKGYYENEVRKYINDTLRPTAKQFKIPVFNSIEKCSQHILETQRIHTMSITKAAIGLMYHIHEKEYPRGAGIKNGGRTMFSTGQALNMMTGYDDNKWNFDEYRVQVEGSVDLEHYSKKKLSVATKILSWKYNNLVYQLLASNMRDVADKFGEFMGDKAGPLVKEIQEYKNANGVYERHEVWFKHGTSWKWEHTSKGEPLGPHGLWMTSSCSKLLGEKVREHFDMARGERIRIQGGGWSNYKTKSKIKQYWNGWWFSDRCVYAIGHVCQMIAITPKDVRVQIYEENWDSPLSDETNHNDPKWFFIDKIEEEFGYKVYTINGASKLKF
eukprot:g7864.t1